MRKSKFRFIIALLIPLGIGIASALLTRKSMDLYQTFEKPPFSPPAIVFPIAWTILYLMMGAASYLANTTAGRVYDIFIADIWYIIQLTMNFFWSILFFNLRMYLFAFSLLLAGSLHSHCHHHGSLLQNR